MQKLMKLRSWIPQQDGTYKPIDVPGPPDFDAWLSCFMVYRAIILMLRYPATGVEPERIVATPAALDAYLESFRGLVAELPECWHLLCTAEDRARGEAFARVRRQLARAHSLGKLPFDKDYNPMMPWDSVFQHMASDQVFWDREVRRPAILFLARGAPSSTALPMVSAGTAKVMQNLAMATGQVVSADGGLMRQKASFQQGESKSAVRRRNQRLKAETEVPPAASKGNTSSGSGDTKPPFLTKGRLFSANTEGKEICYKYAKAKSLETAARALAHSVASTSANIVSGSTATRSVRRRMLSPLVAKPGGVVD